ncbi:MAG: sugar transferase [Eubacteriaceae bacterium]|nr:sugar transferase [Eubacteriaceae bacterium]
MYKKYNLRWLKHLDFILLDVLCLHTAFIISYMIRHGVSNPYAKEGYLMISVVFTIVDFLSAISFESMKNVLKRGYYREMAATIKHSLIVIALTVAYMFTIKESETYSRAVFLMMVVLYPLTAYTVRVLWKKRVIAHLQNAELSTVIVITIRDYAEKLVRDLSASKNVVGVITMDSSIIGEPVWGSAKIVSSYDNAAEYICRLAVDEVYICVPRDWALPRKLIGQIISMGIAVHVEMDSLTDFDVENQFVEKIGGRNVITAALSTATPMQAFLKRALDILGGIVGCAVTLLLCVFIAPTIKILSPGPVFFKQERVGRGGRRFMMYKFRSMYMDAEERKAALMKDNRIKDGMMFKLEEDPRIIGSRFLEDGTYKKGFGNFIRDTSLDEFPQFFNVLRGDMSLVGTRPPTVDEWERYELHHRARLAIKPGITGLWQVSGRSEITDFEKVVELDKKYICEWSLGLDLRILVKTVGVVLGKKGSM